MGLVVFILGSCVVLTSGLQSMKNSNGDPDIGNIIQHVTTLEKSMKTFLRQYQANNVEMESVKAKVKATENKLQTTCDELAVVKTKLESFKKSSNVSHIIDKLQTDVSFQVIAHVKAGLGHLKFDSVKTNRGQAYHSRSGMFNPPLSGTYLFWANIKVATGHIETASDHYIRLISDGDVLATGLGRTEDGRKQALLTITHVVHLKQGSLTYFQLNSTLSSTYAMKHASSYGGTLLRFK